MIRYLLIIASGFTAPINTVNSCEKLTAEGAWVRQPPPGHTHVAAYMTLTNTGSQPINLTGVQSAEFDSAMIHETIYVKGQARMRHIPTLALAPGSTVRAKPGGVHVMLTGPKRPIDAERVVDLRFECDTGGALTISLPVRRNAPE